MDSNMNSQMDYSTMSKKELLEKCADLGKTKVSSKTKAQLIELLTVPVPVPATVPMTALASGSLNVLDLFCGCGGMSKGLTDAGLNGIAGIGIWNKAVES